MKVLKVLKIIGICILSITILLVLLLLCMLGGVDFTTYPEEKASSWICNDPYIEIHYRKMLTEAHLEWEGETIPVFIGTHSSTFDVYRMTPGQMEIRTEDLLFRGEWHYEWNYMVVEICEDYIFNGAYTELVFVPQ